MQAPGFRPDGWQPKFVVVGLDFRLTYDSLQRACSAIRAGAHFIATNADATLPVEGGELWPGAGSIRASSDLPRRPATDDAEKVYGHDGLAACHPVAGHDPLRQPGVYNGSSIRL